MELIHKQINAIMADLGAVGKDQRNAGQGFNYRGIDDIYDAVHPLMAKHGVYNTCLVMPGTIHTEEHQSRGGGLLLYCRAVFRYTLFAEDGSNVSTDAIGMGMDSGDKAFNKAMAVAHKYAISQMFVLAYSGMDDPDADSPEPVARKEPPKPKPKPEPKKDELTEAADKAFNPTSTPVQPQGPVEFKDVVKVINQIMKIDPAAGMPYMEEANAANKDPKQLEAIHARANADLARISS